MLHVLRLNCIDFNQKDFLKKKRKAENKDTNKSLEDNFSENEQDENESEVGEEEEEEKGHRSNEEGHRSNSSKSQLAVVKSSSTKENQDPQKGRKKIMKK